MSDLLATLTTVTEVKPHSNADRLDIAIINGWQTVIRKDSMQAGEPVIYVAIDSLVPDEWATQWGVRPTMESQHPTIGRLILKYVSDTYLTAKGDAAEDLSNDAAEVA